MTPSNSTVPTDYCPILVHPTPRRGSNTGWRRRRVPTVPLTHRRYWVRDDGSVSFADPKGGRAIRQGARRWIDIDMGEHLIEVQLPGITRDGLAEFEIAVTLRVQVTGPWTVAVNRITSMRAYVMPELCDRLRKALAEVPGQGEAPPPGDAAMSHRHALTCLQAMHHELCARLIRHLPEGAQWSGTFFRACVVAWRVQFAPDTAQHHRHLVEAARDSDLWSMAGARPSRPYPRSA